MLYAVQCKRWSWRMVIYSELYRTVIGFWLYSEISAMIVLIEWLEFQAQIFKLNTASLLPCNNSTCSWNLFMSIDVVL